MTDKTLNVKGKQEIITTGISMTVEQMFKLTELMKFYDAKRSPIVAALIDQQYDQLIEEGKIDARHPS